MLITCHCCHFHQNFANFAAGLRALLFNPTSLHCRSKELDLTKNHRGLGAYALPNTFLPLHFLVTTMDQQTSVITRAEECGIKVHIGSLIGEELKRQRRPAAWLAQEICCGRTNVYKILRKGSIDTELLCRISVALDHDFFVEFQSACGFRRTPSVTPATSASNASVNTLH